MMIPFQSDKKYVIETATKIFELKNVTNTTDDCIHGLWLHEKKDDEGVTIVKKHIVAYYAKKEKNQERPSIT